MMRVLTDDEIAELKRQATDLLSDLRLAGCGIDVHRVLKLITEVESRRTPEEVGVIAFFNSHQVVEINLPEKGMNGELPMVELLLSSGWDGTTISVPAACLPVEAAPGDELLVRFELRKCRECGCTGANVCAGGCEWVEVDVCSRCKPALLDPTGNPVSSEIIVPKVFTGGGSPADASRIGDGGLMETPPCGDPVAADGTTSPAPDTEVSELSLEGLKGIEILGARRQHGDRLRYMAGCRCVPCRAANSRYESGRLAARKRGEWDGIVDARRARRHILKLSGLGVGYKLVADASRVAQSTVFKIRSGRRPRIRASTERKILAVDKSVVGDGSLVSAKQTWRLIGLLLDEGFTKKEIARRLGYCGGGLHFNRTLVTARTALKVRKLYDSIQR